MCKCFNEIFMFQQTLTNIQLFLMLGKLQILLCDIWRATKYAHPEIDRKKCVLKRKKAFSFSWNFDAYLYDSTLFKLNVI